MKSKTMSVFLFLLFAAGSSFAKTSQPAPIVFSSIKNHANNQFGMFLIHRQGKDVAMMWTVSNPGQVARYEILRSYDGEFFDTIKDMPGGNGSRCRYTDSNVYAGYIHYKVRAIMHDESVVESDVETIRIVSRK
jgi:hypothetical protein